MKINNIKRIIFITTTDIVSGRINELNHLISSINLFSRHHEVDINHFILCQRHNPEKDISSEMMPSTSKRQILYTTERVSLSLARNKIIGVIPDHLFDHNCVVAFPDDDAWYPEGTLEYLVDCFNKDINLDFCFTRYGGDARFVPESHWRVPKVQDVISHGSSNTIFVRGHMLNSLGGFDEKLGLGTKAVSGEDTDFAIRAFFLARRTHFISSKIVGHRDFSKELSSKYYQGAVLAMRKNLHHSFSIRLALWRKFLVGFYYFITGRLGYSALFLALRNNSDTIGN